MKAPAFMQRLSSPFARLGLGGNLGLTVLLSAAVLVLYLQAVIRGNYAPGSTLGIGFGVGAVVALAGVMAYSVNRGLPKVRKLGRRTGYLQLHIWGGILFAVLVLVHTDFRVPSGVLTFTLWAVSLWVIVTGAVGLLFQRSIPRILGPAASLEVHLHRIPELVQELRERAEAAVAEAEPRVQSFYQEEYAPEMAAPQMSLSSLLRKPEEEESRGGAVEILRRTLPEDGAVTLDRLRELRRAKHEMDAQFTLQRILRGWLYLHLPVAVVLLALVLLHVFFVLYY